MSRQTVTPATRARFEESPFGCVHHSRLRGSPYVSSPQLSPDWVRQLVHGPDHPTRSAREAASWLPGVALVVVAIRFPLVARGKPSLASTSLGC